MSVSATFRVDAQRGGDYQALILTDLPVGYWRLGEAVGATLADDSSGNSRTGTKSAAGVTFGQTTNQPDSNTAALFTAASSGYISMGDVSAFEFTSAFSVECWVKFTSAAAVALVTKALEGSAKGWGLFTGGSANGKIRFLAYNSAGTALWDFETTAAYNDGAWHHVVVTWDGTTGANKVIIYLDGVSVKTATAAAGTPDTNAAPFAIGSYGDLTGSFLGGTADEVAVYNYALTAAQIAIHKLAGAWTSLASDLARADPLTWARGMTGGGPLDLMAGTGRCEFSMRNDGSSGLIGRWSPNHANCTAGWTYGIPIRVVATYASVDYPLWRGTLDDVLPMPGLYRERRVRCVALDCMNDLATNAVQSVEPQANSDENKLIAAIIAALPIKARPFAVSYDTSLDTYTYALYNASSDENAAGLLLDVLTSAQAFAYPLKDGSLYIENRHARALAGASSFTFTDATMDDIEVPSNRSSAFDFVRATVHPKSSRTVDGEFATILEGSGLNVLFAISSSEQAIPPGQTVTIWGDYTDETNTQRLIGGTDQIPPVMNVDYAANTEPDGTGTDISASITLVTSAYAASVRFDITNRSGQPAYMVSPLGAPLLRIRGTSIFDDAAITVQSAVTGSGSQVVGATPLDIDLLYQTDPNVAQDLANFVHARYVSLADQVNGLRFNPQKSGALMTQALSGEIGDIVTASEAVTGTTSVEVAIQGIEGEVVNAFLSMHYITAPRGPSQLLILDDAVFGVLDAAEAVLGYA